MLIQTLGEKLASLGRMEWLGPLERYGSAAQGLARSNSAHRVRALHDAFGVSAEQRAALQRLEHPAVLLIDDQVDSGWTMTLAGRALRQAGAGAVLPFVLAKVR
jgi:ATP-dependent DNA helicase RecQ